MSTAEEGWGTGAGTGSPGDFAGAARTGSTWLGEKRIEEVIPQLKALRGRGGQSHVRVAAPSGLGCGWALRPSVS